MPRDGGTHTMDLTYSSTENSPFTSPFQSPKISPASSRNTSPTRLSTRGGHLKRANSYRKSNRKGMSKMNDMIRRRTQRHRSQSDTDITADEDKTSEKETAKIRREKKSISEDFSEHFKVNSTQNSRPTSTHSAYSDSSRPGTPDRKKSISQMLDLRRLIELSPKLHRHKNRAKTPTDEPDNKETSESGPLFQATTMWVPGYDFKTKQQTSLDDERGPSRSFLSRRGSKDRNLLALLGSSSPNLLRRGSKDKIEKQEPKGKQKYTRCDTSPLPVNLGRPQHEGGTKNALRQCKSDHGEFMSVSQRSAILAQKHQDFRDLKKSRNTEPEPPKGVIASGNVAKISNTFEDGSIYVKPTEDLTTMKKTEKRFSGEYDNIVRERAESFESGEAFRQNKRRSYSTYDGFRLERHGSESGYASPTESNISDVCAPPQINIIPHDAVEFQSWRDAGVWDESTTFPSKSNHLKPPGANELSMKMTNLCVTEL
eukprot:TCONS_00048801-protein